MNTWQDNCEIRPNKNDTISVFHVKTESFLRFESNHFSIRSEMSTSGDYFWDLYGTEFDSIELAKQALNKASEPLNKLFIEYKIKLI